MMRHQGQAVTTGLLTAFVGYASSVAVVLQGLAAMGATQAQSASAVMAQCLAIGCLAVFLSWRTRMPVSIAWSTPGAAMMAASAALPGGFAAAVGAFIVTGGLLVLAALWPLLGRLVRRIPASVASAMLAGVLLKLCLAPFLALGSVPLLALPVLLVWAVLMRLKRLWAVPVAAALALLLIALTDPPVLPVPLLASPVMVMPLFDWQAVVGLALPLFLVTMASQNIPGLTVLSGFGYRPEPRPLLLTTGVASVLVAPFGGLSINLAAITAALCAGPEAGPDPARRWQAAVWSGLAYFALIPLGGLTAAVVLTAPPLLIQAVAGLALLGALGGALAGAVKEEGERLPALVTFLVAASGLTVWGIGAAFWGLVAGGVMSLILRWQPR